jgi:hypothetical protein
MPTSRPGQHSGEYVSLVKYIDERLKDRDEAIRTAHASLDRRLDTMNEFRQSLRDQGLLFLTKTEHDAWKLIVDRQLESLMNSRASSEGKSSVSILVAVIALVVTTIISYLELRGGL